MPFPTAITAQNTEPVQGGQVSGAQILTRKKKKPEAKPALPAEPAQAPVSGAAMLTARKPFPGKK